MKRNQSYYTKKTWRTSAGRLVSGIVASRAIEHSHHCKCGKDWSHYQDETWCKKQGDLGSACDDCFFGLTNGG